MNGLSVLVKNDKTAKNYTITNYTTKDRFTIK